MKKRTITLVTAVLIICCLLLPLSVAAESSQETSPTEQTSSIEMTDNANEENAESTETEAETPTNTPEPEASASEDHSPPESPAYSAEEAEQTGSEQPDSSEEEWTGITDEERYTLNHIPEDILSQIDTPTLIQAILDSYSVIEVYAYSTFQAGVEAVTDRFNGLQELFRRPDAKESLISVYINKQPLTQEEIDRGAGSLFDLNFLEIFLGQAEILNQMNEQEKLDLIDAVMEKIRIKRTMQDLYSDFSTYSFETILLEQNLSDMLAIYLQKMEEANLPTGPDTRPQIMPFSTMPNTPRTPKGTWVTNAIYSNRSMDAKDRKSMRERYKGKYSSKIEIAEPNWNYQCHSYAYYNQTLNNKFSLSPGPYWDDGSYVNIGNLTDVTIAKVQVGDILYYANGGGTSDDHSAIVVRVGSGTLWVESKWGAGATYRHKYWDCPYGGLSKRVYRLYTKVGGSITSPGGGSGGSASGSTGGGSTGGGTAVAPPAQPKPDATGAFDSFSSTYIRGWAYNPKIPNTPIEAHIYITNKQTGAQKGFVVKADLFRQDLYNIGAGNGKHAFKYFVRWNDFPPGEYKIEVYAVDGTGNHPLLGTGSYSWHGSGTYGHVDYASPIQGWAYNPGNKSQSIGVSVYIEPMDNNPNASYIDSFGLTASQDRDDLDRLGYGRYHGYSYNYDWSKLPQGKYNLSVHANIGNGTKLINTTTYTVTRVSGVKLNKSSTSLYVGNAETLAATVSPSNATNKAVTWSSSNTNVARVNASGKITAVDVGTATITARTKDGNHGASCTVTVKPVAVTGIRLNKSFMRVSQYEFATLDATLIPSNATNKNIIWTSSNNNIVSAYANNIVPTSAHLFPRSVGTATITATTPDGKYSASCEIEVSDIDFTNYNQALSAAEKINRNEYTPTTVESFAMAYGIAVDMPDQMLCSQKDINNVTDALNQAIDNLVSWPVKESDYTLFQESDINGNGDQLIRYDGSWRTVEDSLFSGGSAMRASSRGDSVSFRIDGRKFKLISCKTPSGGIVDIAIDGIDIAQVDLYANNGNEAYQQVIFESPTLKDGAHLVTVTVSGKNTSSSGYGFDLDAIRIAGELTAPENPMDLSLFEEQEWLMRYVEGFLNKAIAEVTYQDLTQIHAIYTNVQITPKTPATKIPAIIGRFTNLEYFTITTSEENGNRIASIDSSIGDLRKLKYLILNETQLAALPNSISNIPTLEGLKIFSDKTLTKLPDGIRNLPKLTHIELVGNTINQLPDISHLNLTGLYLTNNSLTSIPSSSFKKAKVSTPANYHNQAARFSERVTIGNNLPIDLPIYWQNNEIMNNNATYKSRAVVTVDGTTYSGTVVDDAKQKINLPTESLAIGDHTIVVTIYAGTYATPVGTYTYDITVTPDKAGLNQVIESASSVNRFEYTPEAANAFWDAYQAATKVKASSQALLAEVESATAALTEAVANLIPWPVAEENYQRFQEDAADENGNAFFNYTGAWEPAQNPSFDAGASMETTGLGDTVSFRMEGRRFRLYSCKSPMGGIMDICIDGMLAGQIDLYQAGDASYREMVFESAVLEDAVHTVTINVTGKNQDSSGHNFYLDTVDVAGTLTEPTVLVDPELFEGEEWLIRMAEDVTGKPLNEITNDDLKRVTSIDDSFITEETPATKIPAAIKYFTNLESISITTEDGNRLASIDSGIGNLKKLTSITLHNTQLTDLPNELCVLSNLKTLDLQYNQRLTGLPDDIGNLTQLTTLKLNNNALTDLPQSIEGLVNVASLSLDGNALTSLPTEWVARNTNAGLPYTAQSATTFLTAAAGQNTPVDLPIYRDHNTISEIIGNTGYASNVQVAVNGEIHGGDIVDEETHQILLPTEGLDTGEHTIVVTIYPDSDAGSDPIGTYTYQVAVVDKTALAEAIAQAEGLDSLEYTSDSWTALAEALAEAVRLNGDDLASGQNINTARNNLTVAISNLEEWPVLAGDYVRFQETSPFIEYGGTWSTTSSNGFSGSAARRSTTLNDTATFTMVGRKFQLQSYKSGSQGIIEIFIDGVSMGRVDLYDPSFDTLFQQVVFESPLLENTEHRVKIKIVGKNANSTGYSFYLDALDVAGEMVEASPSVSLSLFESEAWLVREVEEALGKSIEDITYQDLENMTAITGGYIDDDTPATKIPAIIGFFTNLESIHITHPQNKIALVDESIGELTKLKEIVLYNTALSYLPDSLCSLWALETLELGDNYYLTGLPEFLGYLPELRWLSITGNPQLTALPHSFDEPGSLPNLMGIDLHGNALTDLPYSLLQKCGSGTAMYDNQAVTFSQTITLGENIPVKLPIYWDHNEALDGNESGISVAINGLPADGFSLDEDAKAVVLPTGSLALGDHRVVVEIKAGESVLGTYTYYLTIIEAGMGVLEELIAEAEGINRFDYTPSTGNRFATAYEEAVAVWDKEDATQNEITNAVHNLRYSLSQLVEWPVEESDYTACQENSTDFLYMGNWSQVSNNGFSEGGAMRATAVGESVSFQVYGRKFQLYSYRSSSQGMIDIAIDGVSMGQVDLYDDSLNVHFQDMVYESPVMEYTSHTVTITVVGRNETSTGYSFYMDEVRTVGSLVSPEIPTGSLTTPISNNDKSLILTLPIGLEYTVQTEPAYGTLTLDGGKVYYTATAFAASDEFTLDIRGESVTVTVDRAAAMRYEDSFAGFTVSSGWTRYSAASYSGGTALRSSTTDASIEFAFTGSGMDIISYKSASRGQFMVIVDEGTEHEIVETVDCYDSVSDKWFNTKVNSATSALTPGEHTVKIVVMGTKNANSTGTAVEFDAVLIRG